MLLSIAVIPAFYSAILFKKMFFQTLLVKHSESNTTCLKKEIHLSFTE